MQGGVGVGEHGAVDDVGEAPLTQARSNPTARAFLDRRSDQGDARKEAIRSLKWHDCA